ncbi:two component, sigma54 specific, transcriptional regulator, Fis family [Dissulfuribacter thermophilus]|uniref:Two component, sigma54 specific, transcriptional regulator, Fis family n=1 Tax=Dissulfuribacter thermophilus TaxID=1156395 RepID=A0A1B9F8Q2_9BACT|nr:sigma-54 dependent transcriptional regulator [Dissulfuribacter thermophilus]OCC16318.1 two component, sigma54 specific, transcriptional regulator, Fis family [Dissulfuribacter thermophilus]
MDIKLIGKSPKIREVLRLISRVAPLGVQVLISGETGTGKGLAARIIHQLSPRKDKPFVTVQCGAIPDTLIESALFGHEKGAFTGASTRSKGFFEEAHKGTLLLDEIGDSSMAFQTALLHVLQEEEFCKIGSTRPTKVDVRIVAATNKDLRKGVSLGTFRQDLFFRLNVVEIKMPPLRDRDDDCMLIAEHFLHFFNQKYKKKLTGLSKEVKKIFMQYHWPGNVRELIHVVERAVIVEQSSLITPASLPPQLLEINQEIDNQNEDSMQFHLPLFDKPLKNAKREFEKKYLEGLLRRVNGNVSMAANLSGLRRQNLYLKIQQYEIDLDQFRKKK